MSRTGLTNRRRPGCKEKELIFGTWNVRPRNRWADVVHRDALQLLGIRGWRRRNGNRDEWRRLVREAKARKGLWRHLRMGIRHIYIYICRIPPKCFGYTSGYPQGSELETVYHKVF